jgi:hypothetical protein
MADMILMCKKKREKKCEVFEKMDFIGDAQSLKITGTDRQTKKCYIILYIYSTVQHFL